MIKVEVVESKCVRTIFFESSKPGDKDEIDNMDKILELIMSSGASRGEYLSSGVLAISKEIKETESN